MSDDSETKYGPKSAKFSELPDTPAPRELDHPCKQTCSGWKQGFERGEESMKRRALIAEDKRDAALAMRDEYLSRLQEKCDDVLALIEEKKTLTKERDELKAEIEEVRKAGQRLLEQALTFGESARKERDRLRAALERIAGNELGGKSSEIAREALDNKQSM